MTPLWVRDLVGLVVAVLLALLVAPLVPAPGSTIVGVVCWLLAAVFLVLLVVHLVVSSRPPA